MRDPVKSSVPFNPYAQINSSLPNKTGVNPLLSRAPAPVDCDKILKQYKGTLSEDVYKKGVDAKCPGFRGGKKSRRRRTRGKKSRGRMSRRARK